MVRRSLHFIVAAGCCFAVADACRAADDPKSGPVVVRFWHSISGLIGQAFEAQAETFNATHPDVRVEVALHKGYDGTRTDFQKAQAAGDPPEIAVIAASAVLTMASQGNIASISELIRGDDDFDADDIIPATLYGLRWNDELYAVPTSRSTLVLYYNKQRFKAAGLDPDKPPRTWTELREAARKLTTDPSKSYGVILAPSTWMFETMVFGAGGELMDADLKKATFVNSATKPLQRWTDMVNRDKTARSSTWDDFWSGQAAMYFESCSLVTLFESNAQNLDVGVGFVPFEEGHRPGVTISGGAAIIPKQLTPEKRRAAWQYLKWLVSTERTAEFSRQTGYVPVRKSAVELLKKSGFYSEHPYHLIAVEQLAFAKEVPPVLAWNRARSGIVQGIIRCFRDDQKADVSLTRAAGGVERIFANEAAAKKKK
jgi:sn-glycerol 3-phosphate transport system substrate-binding protein